MTGKLADQIPAHVPTIDVVEGKSSDGVVTARQVNPLVWNLMFLISIQYLFSQFGLKGEIIFGGDEKMRTSASLESIDKKPGADGCPTLA